jgi:hypothetical protein
LCNTVAAAHVVDFCLRRSCPVQPDHGASLEEEKEQSNEQQKGRERERSYLFEK